METIEIQFDKGHYGHLMAEKKSWDKDTKPKYTAYFIITINIGELQCTAGLHVLNEFENVGAQINEIFTALYLNSSLIFKDWRQLQIYGLNEFEYKNSQAVNISPPHTFTISLEVKKDLFDKLLLDCNSKLHIDKMFDTFKDYIFHVNHWEVDRDHYIKSCFDFLNSCITKSQDQYFRINDLASIRADYFSKKYKEESVNRGQRQLYSRIRAPKVYNRVPIFSDDVKGLYKHLESLHLK